MLLLVIKHIHTVIHAYMHTCAYAYTYHKHTHTHTHTHTQYHFEVVLISDYV